MPIQNNNNFITSSLGFINATVGKQNIQKPNENDINPLKREKLWKKSISFKQPNFSLQLLFETMFEKNNYHADFEKKILL